MTEIAENRLDISNDNYALLDSLASEDLSLARMPRDDIRKKTKD